MFRNWFFKEILANQRTIMTLLDDTKAALTQLSTDVNTAITDIQAGSSALHKQIDDLKAQLAAGGTVSAADLQALHDGLVAIDNTVVSASKNLVPPTA